MKSQYKFVLIVVSLILLAGCSWQSANIVVRENNRYASGFALYDSARYRVAVLYSPWDKGNEMQRYYLTRDTSDSKEMKRMQGKTVVQVPLERIGLTSCTHLGFLDAIDGLSSVIGMCSPELAYCDLDNNPHILNLGDAMTPNVERIVLAHSDMMFVSTYAHGDATSAQLVKLGVPVLYINEWMEQHPLARAEWIRLVGAFLDKEALADSVFNSVATRYEQLCEQVKTVGIENKPSIMSGQDFRGTWYVPAGNTFMGRLFRDAGASYRYEDMEHDGSIPLTLEQAMVDFADADVWIGVTVRSLKELALVDKQHRMFRSYQTGRVYHLMRRSTPSGGNDFWERGVVHPDEILGDLVSVLYPDLVSSACPGLFPWQPVFIEQLR
ncbi:MAG: ABC transporter substrate-binding protein [Paludibacteraceae bacterium]|nr:ABC transporter substrate-binding protein [Paludibacteraceae bacterium]